MPPDLSLICMSSLIADWSPENERKMVKGLVCPLQNHEVQLPREGALPAQARAVTPVLARSSWGTEDRRVEAKQGTAFCGSEN